MFWVHEQRKVHLERTCNIDANRMETGRICRFRHLVPSHRKLLQIGIVVACSRKKKLWNINSVNVTLMKQTRLLLGMRKSVLSSWIAIFVLVIRKWRYVDSGICFLSIPMPFKIGWKQWEEIYRKSCSKVSDVTCVWLWKSVCYWFDTVWDPTVWVVSSNAYGKFYSRITPFFFLRISRVCNTDCQL